MTQNVVDFPKHRIVREAINDEAVETVKERSRTNLADTIIEELIFGIIDELENFGVDVATDTFNRDFSVAVDMLRATVYRTLSVPHRLHSFIDNNVTVVPKSEEDSLAD